MKKTIQINIGDKLFYIDDDAYDLLKRYLSQLAETFRGTDGEEIVGDIEMRIGELFSEYVAEGHNIIDLGYVNRVIDIVGRPEEIGENGVPNAEPAGEDCGKANTESEKVVKKLYRDPNDKVFGGVIGGLAKYLGWDATVMRVLLVILALLTSLIPVTFIYLVAWMVIPVADTPRKQLELRGEPVTVETVGQNMREAEEKKKESGSSSKELFNTIMSVAGKMFMAAVGFVAMMVGSACLVALPVLLYLLGGLMLLGCEGMGASMGAEFGVLPELTVLWMLMICVFVLIPNIAIFWAAGSVLFNWRGASKPLIVAAVVIELMALSTFFIMLFYLINNGVFDMDYFLLRD